MWLEIILSADLTRNEIWNALASLKLPVGQVYIEQLKFRGTNN